MLNNKDFEALAEHLLAEALADYRQSKQSQLQEEKLEKMQEACHDILSEPDFVYDCFDIILDAANCEKQALYRRGLSDGINILKSLGVLS